MCEGGARTGRNDTGRKEAMKVKFSLLSLHSPMHLLVKKLIACRPECRRCLVVETPAPAASLT